MSRKLSLAGTSLAALVSSLPIFAWALTPPRLDVNQSPPAALAPIAASEPSPISTPPPLPSEPLFFYADNGKAVGPLSLVDLRAKVAAGAIGPATLVWKSGTPNWVPAGGLAELSSSFPSAVASPTPNQPVATDQAGAPVAAIPLVEHWTKLRDAQENAFTVDVPQNWKDTGGTARRNALQYRNWVSAISPDGATLIAINDPNEWSYIAPSPMLAAAGLRVGSLYNGGGDTVYTVAPYQSGQQFAVSWGQSRLASICSAVAVTDSRPRPDLAQKINAFGIAHDVGEASFTCKRNNLDMTAYALVSMTYLGASSGIWYADTIVAFLAPTKVAGVAAGVLAHVAKSFEFDLAWLAKVSNDAAALAHAAAQTNAAVSDMIMQGWEARGAAIDRAMDEGSRTRLGIDIYRDPSTGDAYTVANQYKYYWVNPSGTVVGTDTDTPPNGYRRMDRVPP